MARNTDFSFVQTLLLKLKTQGAPDWSKSAAQTKKDAKTQPKNRNANDEHISLKNLHPKQESGPPSYNSRTGSAINIHEPEEKYEEFQIFY